MSDNKFKKGIQDIKNMHMTLVEKQVMLERIQSKQSFTKHAKSPMSIYFFMTWARSSRFVSIGVLVLIVAVSGGSLAYAAEGSLPGDVLYPVKVKVTEPVRDIINQSPEADAKWQLAKAERRMQEAEDLSTLGTLDDSKEKEVRDLLDEHTKSLSKALEKIRQDNADTSDEIADDISATFQSEMNARARVLDIIVQDTNVAKIAREKAKDIKKLAMNKKNTRNMMTAVMATKVSNKKVESKKKVRALIKTTTEDLNRLATGTSPVEEKIIQDTHETLDRATDSFNKSEQENDSGEALQDSDTSAREATIFLKKGLEINKKLQERLNVKLNRDR